MPVFQISSSPKLSWFELAVSSIINQDYLGKIKIVLIDDGSSDDTFAHMLRLSSLFTSTIREFVLLKQVHKGVTKALNYGLSESDAEYIFRLDSDDYAYPSRVAKQVALLESNEKAYLISTPVRIVRGDQITSEIWCTLTDPNSFYRELRNGNPICHSSVAFRRQVLRSIGFYNEQFPNAQDYELWWRIAQRYQIAGLPEPLTYHRLHRDRVTEKNHRVQSDCSRRIKNRIRIEFRS